MVPQKISQKSTVEFYASCYEILRNIVLQHPDKNIDELWHYVMQPMRDKGYALLHTNLYNRHPIKNFVFRCFYYFQEVLRIPSPALKEDIYWPTLEGKVPFEYKNEPFWELFKKMHDDLLSNYELVYWVYREKIMSNVNDLKRVQQGRKPIGVPQKVQDDYVDDHVRKLMTDMHFDTLPKVGFILEANKDLFINGFRPIIAHSRRGVANPAGYDGARYAVMSGFLTLLISLMPKSGESLYIQNIADESRHWNKGDLFDHGKYETSNDFEFKIEHDTSWEAFIHAITILSQATYDIMDDTQNETISTRMNILRILLIASENLTKNPDFDILINSFKNKLSNKTNVTWETARQVVAPYIKRSYEQILHDASKKQNHNSYEFEVLDSYLFKIYYNFIFDTWTSGTNRSPREEESFYHDSIVSKLTPPNSSEQNWRFDWDRQDYVESVYKVLFIH